MNIWRLWQTLDLRPILERLGDMAFSQPSEPDNIVDSLPPSGIRPTCRPIPLEQFGDDISALSTNERSTIGYPGYFKRSFIAIKLHFYQHVFASRPRRGPDIHTQQLIRDNPLGILTTAIKSPAYPLIQSSHIPFVLDVPETADGSLSNGVLRGHMAKQNPQAKAVMEALTVQQEQGNISVELSDEVLVLLNGPHHHYVTPKFYTETKPATGKVVPTWNYAAAQAYGKIRIYCDSKSEETTTFLQKQVEELSHQSETSIMKYSSPWQVSDAPVPYIDLLKKNIIGIEITMGRLQGKFKMSQEMGQGDREGVLNGFDNMGTDVGRGIANMVRERGEMKDKK